MTSSPSKPKRPPSARRVLSRALQILSVPEVWARGCDAANAPRCDPNRTSYDRVDDPGAKCFCLKGAIRRAYVDLGYTAFEDTDDPRGGYEAIRDSTAYRHLDRLIFKKHSYNVVDFNDTRKSVDSVLSILKEAIASLPSARSKKGTP